MPLVILYHLLNVSVQLANKRGIKKCLHCPLRGNGSTNTFPRQEIRKGIKLLGTVISVLFVLNCLPLERGSDQ
jgi:hypothetical protein